MSENQALVEQVRSGESTELQVLAAQGILPLPAEELIPLQVFLAGSDSVPVVAKATHEASAAIPHAGFRVLAGHGHLAHRTDPAMVADIIRDFVASGAHASP